MQGSQHRQQQLGVLLLAVSVLAHVVAADVKQLSPAVLGEQPLWMRNRSADIVLNFQKADPNYKHPSLGVVAVRGKPMKVNFHIGYYHGNVAMVRFGAKFMLAVRKMHFYKTLRSDLQGYPLSDKKGECTQPWQLSSLHMQASNAICLLYTLPKQAQQPVVSLHDAVTSTCCTMQPILQWSPCCPLRA
jgi:hypothetical protein